MRRLWDLGIGECTARGELPPRRHPWFYDNGAFGDWKAGKPFDEAQFLEDIEAIEKSADPPRFIIPPDLVAQGLKSMAESLRWLPRLERVAPAYLAVQDGMEAEDIKDVAPQLAGIFVGGTLAWKLSTGGGLGTGCA